MRYPAEFIAVPARERMSNHNKHKIDSKQAAEERWGFCQSGDRRAAASCAVGRQTGRMLLLILFLNQKPAADLIC